MRARFPVLAREVLARLLAQYDCHIRELAKQSEASRRLLQVRWQNLPRPDYQTR